MYRHLLEIDGLRAGLSSVAGLAWQSLLVPRLEQVRAEHARAILAFERENRAYFATWISDRGDEYFDQFTARHQEMLAEQAAGKSAFYVLVDGDGEVLGRFNLYDIEGAGAKGRLPGRTARRRLRRGDHIARPALRDSEEFGSGRPLRRDLS